LHTNVEEHLFHEVHEQGQEGPRLLDADPRDSNHRFGHLRDRSTVLDGYREVDGRFLLADLHRDAASLAGATANALEKVLDKLLRSGQVFFERGLNLLGRKDESAALNRVGP
jgi:hypothetical protein